MNVFHHHIYEYQKGLRNLVLFTEKIENLDKICKRLEKENIPFLIHKIDERKANVYFGSSPCLEVIKTFDTERLDKITNEQDFMLGIMLGYDLVKQCERYITRKHKAADLKVLELKQTG